MFAFENHFSFAYNCNINLFNYTFFIHSNSYN